MQHSSRSSTVTIGVMEGVSLSRFCKTEWINVSKSVVTTMIRPAGRSDVTVSVVGLDFNTLDTLLFDYVKKCRRIIIGTA